MKPMALIQSDAKEDKAEPYNETDCSQRCVESVLRGDGAVGASHGIATAVLHVTNSKISNPSRYPAIDPGATPRM